MKSLQKRHLIEIKLLRILLLTAFILLISGVITPVMTITKLVFMENSFSILSGLRDLFIQQQYMLFLLILILSIILPFIKILLLAWALQVKNNEGKLKKLIEMIHHYGRWAMLDVLVVALLLVAVKLGAIASVEIHLGLYYFAAAVLITMWVTHRTLKIVQ